MNESSMQINADKRLEIPIGSLLKKEIIDYFIKAANAAHC
jgi:hypothetical protein